MKTVKAKIKKGVLEIISIPKGIKLEVVECDNGEILEIVKNEKTGMPREVVLSSFKPSR